MPLIYVVVALIAVGAIAWLINRNITVPTNARTILNVVLSLIVVGIALWLINTYVPMAGSIKAILNVVVVVAVCVGILQAVGLWGRVVGLWDEFRNRKLQEPVITGTAGQYQPPAPPFTSSGPTPSTPHSTKI